MCYLVAKRFKQSGCIAMQTALGEELADFALDLQEKLGKGIQVLAISRPTAYGEYEPYRFVYSFEEFEREASKL